jgi:hypothetical protein
MGYDEGLAFRVRELFAGRRDVVEKSMFGGLAMLVDGHMSVGIVGEDLVVRVGAERHDAALARAHTRVMDFTGRPMKGWIFVSPEGIAEDPALEEWVAWGIETAKTSPEKKPKAGKTPGPAPAKAAAARPEAAKKKSAAHNEKSSKKSKGATKTSGKR